MLNNTHTALVELFEQVAHSRSLTISHQQALMLAQTQDFLTDDDKATIERLLYAIRRGWLKVLEEN